MKRSIKSIKKALARKRKELTIISQAMVSQNKWYPECHQIEREISTLEIELINRKNGR